MPLPTTKILATKKILASHPCARALLAAGLPTLLFALAATTGCSVGNRYPPGSFERGQRYYEAGSHRQAVEAFETYVRQNPTDSLAAEAQYLKGLSYMELEEYPLAAVEFQILRKDYPTSGRVEDASFQEGIAYLEQVGRVERDITGAIEARLHFLDFARNYPGSPHMPEVREYMQQISDMMVRKRLGAVKVYVSLGRLQAAGITLDDILDDEPNSTLLDRVLQQRAEVAMKTEDWDVARRMWERLIVEFPDTPRARWAADRLEKLRQREAKVASGGQS